MVSGLDLVVLVVGRRARELADDRSLARVSVLACEDFADAVSAVRAHHAPVDAIVVDPVTATAVETEAALAVIRSAVHEWPWIPLIAIASPTGSAHFVREVFRAGARDVLLRPLQRGELAATLARLAGSTPGHRIRRPRREPALDSVLAALQQSPGQPVSARVLAATAGLSRWRFSRRFREATGMSFRAYLTVVRLAQARQLLISSSRSITDIAQEVGFYDLPHFDRTFRAWFGVTPQAFRRSGTTPAARTHASEPLRRRSR